MIVSTNSYGSDRSSQTCEFYFHSAESNADEVTDLLKKLGAGAAVKVCTGSNGRKGYFAATPIAEKPGVSYYYLSRVFKVSVAEGYRWDLIPPKPDLGSSYRGVFMQRTVDSSVRQDDAGFIQVSGISTGLFGIISREWENIASSKNSFDKASSNLPMFVKSSSEVKTLKNAFYDVEHTKRAKLDSISFDIGNDSGFPHYSFMVSDEIRVWIIEFDIAGERIIFENISSTVY